MLQILRKLQMIGAALDKFLLLILDVRDHSLEAPRLAPARQVLDVVRDDAVDGITQHVDQLGIGAVFLIRFATPGVRGKRVYCGEDSPLKR
jgi:hypothetical protein